MNRVPITVEASVIGQPNEGLQQDAVAKTMAYMAGQLLNACMERVSAHGGKGYNCTVKLQAFQRKLARAYELLEDTLPTFGVSCQTLAERHKEEVFSLLARLG